jgi:arginase family enzyme
LAVDPQSAVEYLRTTVAAAERVYLDIDCDVFDPLYFPAVTEPVPFGLNPLLLLRLLDAAWTPKLRGVLLSEFEPGRDQQDRSLATVMWLLEYCLLRCYESAGKGGNAVSEGTMS